jgi:glutathione S-transferase
LRRLPIAFRGELRFDGALTEARMLKIWGRANSSNVQKVLWCCDELGVGFERVDAGGAFGRTREPDFLARNPNALVPTVEDGDLVIWESNTIMRYLATTRGGARLYPTNPAARTHVERWMDWQLQHVAPPISALIQGVVRKMPGTTAPETIAAATAKAQEFFAVLDRQLADRNFVTGAGLTLADICVGVFAHRWFNLEIERQELPNLAAWFARLTPRPGFQAHVMHPLT